MHTALRGEFVYSMSKLTLNAKTAGVKENIIRQ